MLIYYFRSGFFTHHIWILECERRDPDPTNTAASCHVLGILGYGGGGATNVNEVQGKFFPPLWEVVG